jgi:hypothetical protein
MGALGWSFLHSVRHALGAGHADRS